MDQRTDDVGERAERLIRPSSSNLDRSLGIATKVLDHGFVRVVDYMGTDESVCQAARVSYGRGTKSVNADLGLINYLMAHDHTTPFEMCHIKLHVKMPIFVARQWVRHRTASLNEYSGRYSLMDSDYYIPKPENVAQQSNTNKQGRGEVFSTELAQGFCEQLDDLCKFAYDKYLTWSSEDYEGVTPKPIQGTAPVARELGRMMLPVNFYTQWYWEINLHNLMHFLKLRMDSHAQFEIREYANVIGGIVEKWVPMTWRAFQEHKLSAWKLSRSGTKYLKARLHGQSGADYASNMSKRELDSINNRFGLSNVTKEIT